MQQPLPKSLDGKTPKKENVVVYPYAENQQALFNKSQIDDLSNNLPNLKNQLSQKPQKTLQDWNTSISPHYSAYYRAELAHTIKAFNYGEQSEAITTNHTGKLVAELEKPEDQPKTSLTGVSFSSHNLLDIAAILAKDGVKFAICNPANNECVGGGAFVGAPNFEEDLFRISDLGISLVKHAREDGDIYYENGRPHYKDNSCLNDNQALITKDVRVIKKMVFAPNDHWYFKQYEKLPQGEQFAMTVVSNAAIYLDKVREFTKKERATTKEKLRAQLTALIEARVDTPILSDFGCGGFHNKPSEIAKIYHDLLYVEQYAKFFTEIKFCIINPKNCKEFETTFSELNKPSSTHEITKQSQGNADASNSDKPFFAGLATRISAYFGANSVGVRNWLLISALSYLGLFSVLILAPPLAPILFLGLTIGFGALCGIGLICALTAGIIAAYQERRMFQQMSGQKDIPYFRYLLQFSLKNWAKNNLITCAFLGLIFFLAIIILPLVAAPLLPSLATFGLLAALGTIIEASGRLIYAAAVFADSCTSDRTSEDRNDLLHNHNNGGLVSMTVTSKDKSTFVLETNPAFFGSPASSEEIFNALDRNIIESMMKKLLGDDFIVEKRAFLAYRRDKATQKFIEFEYIDEKKSVVIEKITDTEIKFKIELIDSPTTEGDKSLGL